MIILLLNSDLIHSVLCEWLNLKDLSILDLSMSEKAKRNGYLYQLAIANLVYHQEVSMISRKDTDAVYNTPNPWPHTYKYVPNLLAWLKSRNISISDVKLNSSTLLYHCHFTKHFISHVNKLIVNQKCISLLPRDMLDGLQKFSNVRIFEYHAYNTLLGRRDIAKIAGNYSKLTTFKSFATINTNGNTCGLSLDALPAIAHYIPYLRVLHLHGTMNAQVFHSLFLDGIILSNSTSGSNRRHALHFLEDISITIPDVTLLAATAGHPSPVKIQELALEALKQIALSGLDNTNTPTKPSVSSYHSNNNGNSSYASPSATAAVSSSFITSSSGNNRSRSNSYSTSSHHAAANNPTVMNILPCLKRVQLPLRYVYLLSFFSWQTIREIQTIICRSDIIDRQAAQPPAGQPQQPPQAAGAGGEAVTAWLDLMCSQIANHASQSLRSLRMDCAAIPTDLLQQPQQAQVQGGGNGGIGDAAGGDELDDEDDILLPLAGGGAATAATANAGTAGGGQQGGSSSITTEYGIRSFYQRCLYLETVILHGYRAPFLLIDWNLFATTAANTVASAPSNTAAAAGNGSCATVITASHNNLHSLFLASYNHHHYSSAQQYSVNNNNHNHNNVATTASSPLLSYHHHPPAAWYQQQYSCLQLPLPLPPPLLHQQPAPTLTMFSCLKTLHLQSIALYHIRSPILFAHLVTICSQTLQELIITGFHFEVPVMKDLIQLQALQRLTFLSSITVEYEMDILQLQAFVQLRELTVRLASRVTEALCLALPRWQQIAEENRQQQQQMMKRRRQQQQQLMQQQEQEQQGELSGQCGQPGAGQNEEELSAEVADCNSNSLAAASSYQGIESLTILELADDWDAHKENMNTLLLLCLTYGKESLQTVKIPYISSLSPIILVDIIFSCRKLRLFEITIVNYEGRLHLEKMRSELTRLITARTRGGQGQGEGDKNSKEKDEQSFNTTRKPYVYPKFVLDIPDLK